MRQLGALLAIPVFLFSGCSLIQLGQPSEKKLYEKKGFDWEMDSTQHFVLYYEAGSGAEPRIEDVKRDVEASLAHNLQLLGETGYTQQLKLFLVESRARMKELIGRETNGVAFYKTNVLCYIVNENMLLSARHELLHVLAMNLWGVPDIWINEGLAVYTDDHWHNHDLHQLLKYLHSQQQLITVDDLVNRFRSKNDLITYPMAGSLVKYIYEMYGLEAVKSIWTTNTIAGLSTIGLNIELLEKEWIDILESIAEKGEINYAVE